MIERLINWSLSDTVTRVIARVGVAYGSDLDLTRKLLMQAAMGEQPGAERPGPHRLLPHLRAQHPGSRAALLRERAGDRNPAIDELNRRIDVLVPRAWHRDRVQPDGRLHQNMQGDEQKVESRPALPPAREPARLIPPASQAPVTGLLFLPAPALESADRPNRGEDNGLCGSHGLSLYAVVLLPSRHRSPG